MNVHHRRTMSDNSWIRRVIQINWILNCTIIEYNSVFIVYSKGRFNFVATGYSVGRWERAVWGAKFPCSTTPPSVVVVRSRWSAAAVCVVVGAVVAWPWRDSCEPRCCCARDDYSRLLELTGGTHVRTDDLIHCYSRSFFRKNKMIQGELRCFSYSHNRQSILY